MVAFDEVEVLSFDCYGTLIDWESGLSQALRPILAAHGVEVGNEPLLEAFASCEAAAESGPYLPYREVLASALRCLGARFGFSPTGQQTVRFAESVGDWPAFPDSPAALQQLKRRYKLAIITNCDDDLFARSNRRLGVEFDWVITAQQAQSYKPAARNFELAIERIGVPPSRLVHVAQSLYHDHVPAKQLGLTTVWINRRQHRLGSGATPPAAATPDLELPDLQSLATLTG